VEARDVRPEARRIEAFHQFDHLPLGTPHIEAREHEHDIVRADGHASDAASRVP
jgi:hypothetical protein